MFIAALFTVAKIWKQTKCPLIHERIKRMWYMYTMKYYLAMSEDFVTTGKRCFWCVMDVSRGVGGCR